MLEENEERRLDSDLMEKLIEQTEAEEDVPMELLSNYREQLPEGERATLSSAIKSAAKNHDCLASYLDGLDWEEQQRPLLPRWAEIVVMFAIGIAVVFALVGMAMYKQQIPGIPEPPFMRSIRAWFAFPDGRWQRAVGLSLLLGILAYALRLFLKEFVQRDRG